MILNHNMSENLVTNIILERIDKFDDKLDTSISDLKEDMTTCKLDIQAVQKDLTNHLNNKKDETESFKRRFYIVTILISVGFTAYATIKELL